MLFAVNGLFVFSAAKAFAMYIYARRVTVTKRACQDKLSDTNTTATVRDDKYKVHLRKESRCRQRRRLLRVDNRKGEGTKAASTL